jgi:hypothetical protein
MLACVDINQPVLNTSTGNYLPLDTGNYWKLGSNTYYKMTGQKSINGKTYFTIQKNGVVSYYRIENNKIYNRNSDDFEGVEFNLNARVNGQWKFGSYTVTLKSKSDVITLGGTKIDSCYCFYFDIPEYTDEENYVWLAPGFGFIQMECGECPEPYRLLKEAKISNVKFVF